MAWYGPIETASPRAGVRGVGGLFHRSTEGTVVAPHLMGTQMVPIEYHGQMVGRLALAAGLGAIVGYEREHVGKPAGVRTHGLVALGSALFTVVSLYGFGEAGDPSRVAAQVVTGIGFLGAGAILHQRGSVRGLTTAASLWATAALGVSVGLGMYVMSAETAVLIFLLLRFGPRPRQGAPTTSATRRRGSARSRRAVSNSQRSDGRARVDGEDGDAARPEMLTRYRHVRPSLARR